MSIFLYIFWKVEQYLYVPAEISLLSKNLDDPLVKQVVTSNTNFVCF